MIRRVSGSLVLAMLISCGYALADVDMQYWDMPGTAMDRWVSTVRDRPPPIEQTQGYGIVTLMGNVASDIVWPAPVAGCLGKPEWTRVTDPGNVTIAGEGLALRTGLIFFTTTSPLLPGCHPVSSWAALRNLMRSAMIASVPDTLVVEALNYHWGWYYARCGDAPTNQNCIDWKANLNIMLNLYPGRGQGIAESAKGATLVNDAIAFKGAQCTANPGGPFC